MGRPLLPIWKEFVTTVPADADKRSPDVDVQRAPNEPLRHALNCPDMPAEELKVAMAEQQQLNQTQNRSEDGETEESEISVTERRPVLGKRPRVRSGQDNLERVLTSIRDQELQLRREELEFQKEALATKMEERRQAREEDRRDRREQSEADRQEKLELARIENEKNLAFLKAVMESSAQQRR
ncbi:hypothetical protein GQ600_22350 [Phytophthora cactorum]|nr:hypothetical protein GQ600_22350 [Phytophthora cactorum]